MLKRIFIVVSIVSMMNLAALAGLGGFAFRRGWLDKVRVHEALEVLRGGGTDKHTASHPTSKPVEKVEVAATSSDQIKRDFDSDEVLRTELERKSQEIQNAWKLLETQQLALVKEKEEFQLQKARETAELSARAKVDKDGGFEKELDILSGLKPKDGKELLRLKPEPDVVRILAALDVRKARKVVSECKSQEERQWIGRILEKLHERDAAQAEVLGGGS